MEKMQYMRNKVKNFARTAIVSESKVKTDYIAYSRRYKGMRVYWAESEIIPKEAFVIGKKGNYWDMQKWLDG